MESAKLIWKTSLAQLEKKKLRERDTSMNNLNYAIQELGLYMIHTFKDNST